MKYRYIISAYFIPDLTIEKIALARALFFEYIHQ